MVDLTAYSDLIAYLGQTIAGRPPGIPVDRWVSLVAERLAEDPHFQVAVAGLAADTITEAIVGQAFPDLRSRLDPILIPATTAATQEAVRRLQRRWSPIEIWIAAGAAVLVGVGLWMSTRDE